LGRKVQEFRPNVVLADAIYSGLSALVRLAYKRKNDQTYDFYKKIHEKWKNVRINMKSSGDSNSNDFSSVQNAESSLRKLYRQMLWYSTKRYGNKEFKRVYDWKEGTVGPLNALLNYAGSVLRDVLVPRYPFPDPDLYEIRKYPDGHKKIVPKSIADKTPPEKGVKTHLRAGYRGNSRSPRVLLTHPTLPALDFGDMIRAHLVELCRQCFIHNVPHNESQKYIRLLIHRMIPFLDWVYTQGEEGRKDFYPDADRELRMIVLEIRTHFSKKIGIRDRITAWVDDVPTNLGIDFLEERVKIVLEMTKEEHIRERCSIILKYIKDGIVTDTEVSKFIEEIIKKTQREGNDWHRVLLSGFSQPSSLKEAVFAGDYLLQTLSGIQYLTEVPVTGNIGAGKIDLVLFARTKRNAGQYIWTPVMILEVKTKAGFKFNLYGIRPRTRKPNVHVPVLYSWKEPLTDSEWKGMLDSIPPKSHLDQLDAYEKAVLSEYNALVGDPLALKKLWKGVVTLDISQDYGNAKNAFDALIDELAQRLLKCEFQGQWKTLKLENKTPDDLAPRIAITITPAQGHKQILKSISPPKAIHFEDPFKERLEDDVFFTQYISVHSPTSSGKSAAWLAKNWHLLNHLAELEETTPSGSSFFWIDLLGDYPTQKMINVRFGLDALKKKRLISQPEYVRLNSFLMRIKFVNLRNETDNLLVANTSSGLETLRASITSSFLEKTEDRFVVVDSWSDLENMVPINRRNNMQILEISLLQILKKLAHEVIWADGGVNHPKVSEEYQRHCVSPLFFNSPRRQVLDEIIWNLPTAPRKMGWLSPQYDDSRVISQDIPTGHEPWTTVIQVPHLRGWTTKFSDAAAKSPIIKNDNYLGILNQLQNMYGRPFHNASTQVRSDAIGRESLDSIMKTALSLIPSLCRPKQKQIKDTKRDVFAQEWTTAYHLVDNKRIQPSLTNRLHLDLLEPPPHPNRLGKDHVGIHVEAEHITRGWIHKEVFGDEDEPSTITRKPPHNYMPRQLHIDTLDTKRREIQRIYYAARFLSRKPSHFQSLFEEVVSLCNYDKSKPVDEGALLAILVHVRDVLLLGPESRLLWKLLLHSRLNLGDLLSVDSQKALKSAQNHNVELLELYGINLFLAVLSVADRILKDVESSLCIDLWSAVARWQFYQIGFLQENNGRFNHRYDFQAIYSNLSRRAKHMKKMVSKEGTRFPERLGQLLWQEGSEGGSIWLLFPSSKNTIYGGLLEGQMSAYLPFGWYRCVMDPQQTKAQAISALSRESWESLPIVLVEVNRQQALYIQSEGEDGDEWTFAGAFEYGIPPKEKSLPVRWVRFSEPLPETLLALHGYRPSSPPSDVQKQCHRVLQEAAGWSGVIREVSCLLTMNLEKRVYRINLLEGSKPIARKETLYSDEVIRFLRYPLRTGEYFSTSDGTYLKWSPLKDIEYDEVMVKNKKGKREYYHLSVFKPFIHRSAFFSDSLSLPSTCEDFLRSVDSGEIIMRINVDEQKKDRGLKKYLWVHLDGLKEKRRISGIESEEMGIFDVALLAECGQLVDMDSGLRYTLSIDAEALVNLGLIHLLSDYSKLEQTILGHIEELESTELDEMDSDADDKEESPKEGPELRLVRVDVEKFTKRGKIDVNIQLCNIEDEDDFEVLTILSLSSEIVKTQSVAYEYIEHEVKRNLRGCRMSEDVRDEILKNVERALEKENVKIDYY
jgi:hypothetical protein